MIRKRVKVLFYSGGTGGEQQRAGRLCNCRGAAGQGAAGEALRPEEDQAGGHDGPLTAGREQDQQSSNTNQTSWSLGSGKLVLICSDLPGGS